jgi:triosephosphate isomerase
VYVQLSVLESWPENHPIIIAYEPGASIGTGQTMSLEDISIVYDLLSQALAKFTHKHILYGGSVDGENIANILKITDGVIIGKACQNRESLMSLATGLASLTEI